MGALMRRIYCDDKEILHISTGKLVAEGESHEPQWSEWQRDDLMFIRFCIHPDCDLEDYKKE